MQCMPKFRKVNLENLEGQPGITMKQGQVNKHKNYGRNKKKEHCRNLAWATSARRQGLPVSDGKDCQCQVARDASVRWHGEPVPNPIFAIFYVQNSRNLAWSCHSMSRLTSVAGFQRFGTVCLCHWARPCEACCVKIYLKSLPPFV